MNETNIMPALGISASALSAQSHRMRIIAENIANTQTTRTSDGTAYRRRDVIFSAELNRKIGASRNDPSSMLGVKVAGTVEDHTNIKQVYRPGHPHADKNGYLTLPNVNPMEEMIDLMVANRSYEANVAAIKTTRSVAQKALEIGR